MSKVAGTKITPEDMADFKKIQEAQPTFDDIKSACPDVRVDENNQIHGSAKGRKQVLAVREMYAKQEALKGARDSKKAEKSEWTVLRDRNGKRKEVRSRNAEHVAKKLGMYEPHNWGRPKERLYIDKEGNRKWYKREGNQWVPLEAQ